MVLLDEVDRVTGGGILWPWPLWSSADGGLD
jgi:hypothetical protein